MTQNFKGSKRIFELDVLRGLAALAVVGYHFYTGMNSVYKRPDNLNFPVFYGYLGVYLFFMISGYVIFMTLEKTKSWKDFVISRFSRLYPAYWAALLLTLLFIAAYPLSELTHFTSRDIVFNFSMLQGFFDFKHIDGVYWTLTVELAFYLLMLILYLSKQLKNIEIIGFLWLLVLNLADHFNFQQTNILGKILLLDYWQWFFAGILFYKLRSARSLKYHLLIAFCLATQLRESVSFSLSIAFVSVLFFSVFYLLAFGRLAFLNKKILVFFGTISYCLYLTHHNIGLITISYLHQIGWSQVFIAVSYFAVILSIAAALTYLVERPALRAIRKELAK